MLQQQQQQRLQGHLWCLLRHNLLRLTMISSLDNVLVSVGVVLSTTLSHHFEMQQYQMYFKKVLHRQLLPSDGGSGWLWVGVATRLPTWLPWCMWIM